MGRLFLSKVRRRPGPWPGRPEATQPPTPEPRRAWRSTSLDRTHPRTVSYPRQPSRLPVPSAPESAGPFRSLVGGSFRNASPALENHRTGHPPLQEASCRMHPTLSGMFAPRRCAAACVKPAPPAPVPRPPQVGTPGLLAGPIKVPESHRMLEGRGVGGPEFARGAPLLSYVLWGREKTICIQTSRREL